MKHWIKKHDKNTTKGQSRWSARHPEAKTWLPFLGMIFVFLLAISLSSCEYESVTFLSPTTFDRSLELGQAFAHEILLFRCLPHGVLPFFPPTLYRQALLRVEWNERLGNLPVASAPYAWRMIFILLLIATLVIPNKLNEMDTERHLNTWYVVLFGTVMQRQLTITACYYPVVCGGRAGP